MARMAAPEPLPEAQRNALLRWVDWRFLLRQQDVPRTLDLTSGRTSRAVQLVTDTAPVAPGTADLVVLGRPTRAALDTARKALRPGGEVVCLSRVPMPAGVRRVRGRLERAGFTDVRLHWPGPLPHRPPQFWLTLDSRAPVERVLAMRPAQSRAMAALRPLWRAAARAGLLAPLCAVARAPGAPGDATDSRDEIDALLPGSQSWVLLTGGKRSINKVVGLPFAEGESEPPVVVKFARVPEVEAALDREAEVLRLLEDERPEVPGIPRLRARGRRAGRLALVESAIDGRPLLSALTPATFGDLALRVTRWLVELAGSGTPQPVAGWWSRLVEGPLGEFERSFGSVLDPGTAERARRLIEGLGDLPQTPEHRDCSPWNVLLTGTGAPALLDWESAEPCGLPALDLTYFLANAAFVLDGALEAGRTRETYARLLDPTTPYGRVAAACLDEYSGRLGLDQDALPRLRLLCWIVHCRSEYRHAEMEIAATPDTQALRGGVFLGLVEEELRR
ncbi:MAG: phosphotransferase [Actinomycetota bacterium]